MTPEMAKAFRSAARQQDTEYRNLLRRQKPKCRCGHLADYNKHGSWVCKRCEPFAAESQLSAEDLTSVLLGETVVTNDRTLNYVLQQAGNIIGRRDIAPLDKIETLFAYLLKARREVLGAVEQ